MEASIDGGEPVPSIGARAASRSSFEDALRELERAEQRVMELWHLAGEACDHDAADLLLAEAGRLRRSVALIRRLFAERAPISDAHGQVPGTSSPASS